MNYRKSEAKEAARAQFRGVWAAITTPFTANDRLDEAGLRRNMRHYTDGLHVDGVFCTGTMGEFWALTKEERKRAVEIVVERDHDMKVHMSSAAPFLMQVPGYTPMRDYAELALAGRFKEAAAIRDGIQPLRDLNEKWLREPWLTHKIIPIHYLKAWSELLGMAGGHVRAPLPQVTADERETMRAELEQRGLLARLPGGKQARAA
jgi:dihydrodipicolinate synthase/N-acetylneuraminate lyase